MKIKYIIATNGYNTPTPFLFPETVKHEEMAQMVTTFPYEGNVVGAGFCYFNTDTHEWVCHGKAASLNIKSRADIDAAVLNRMLQST